MSDFDPQTMCPECGARLVTNLRGRRTFTCGRVDVVKTDTYSDALNGAVATPCRTAAIAASMADIDEPRDGLSEFRARQRKCFADAESEYERNASLRAVKAAEGRAAARAAILAQTSWTLTTWDEARNVIARRQYKTRRGAILAARIAEKHGANEWEACETRVSSMLAD